MYNIIFASGLAMAVIFLIVSIIIFFRNDVPNLIGDLTGRNARKAMEQMRKKDKRIPLKRKGNEKEEDLLNTKEKGWMTEKTAALKMHTEKETDLLLAEQGVPVPAIFETLEDITVFCNERFDKS